MKEEKSARFVASDGLLSLPTLMGNRNEIRYVKKLKMCWPD